MIEKQNIKIAFMGDLFLGGEFINYATRRKIDFLSPLEKIKVFTKKADVVVINLEGPLGAGKSKRPDVKSVLFNNTEIIKFFIEHNKCVINLANNHIMDFGVEGLINTISELDKNSIDFLGAGRNSEEANKELILTIENRKIAFISFTSDAPHIRAIIASDTRAGCSTYTRLENVLTKIKDLKSSDMTVCVMLHWGYEFFQYPSPDQVRMAHTMAESGADIIIGHHPHVIQGIEKYKNSLIVYSLGNLFFPDFRSIDNRIQYVKPLSKEFMLLILELTENKCFDYDVVNGFVNENYEFCINRESNYDAFMKKLMSLSKPLETPDYDSFWLEYKKKRDKEITRESFIEALYKMRKTPLKELIRNLKFDDFKRNFIRIVKIFS